MRPRIKNLFVSLCLSLVGLTGCMSALPEDIANKDCSHWDPPKSQPDSSQLVTNLGWVSDHAEILSTLTEAKITHQLKQLESATQHQMVVVTVENLYQVAIADYARALGNTWGIGRVGENDGVILLVAPNEREVRIAVACGLETVLTNEKAKNIIETAILPYFRNGQYEKGVSAGVTRIASTLEKG